MLEFEGMIEVAFIDTALHAFSQAFVNMNVVLFVVLFADVPFVVFLFAIA